MLRSVGHRGLALIGDAASSPRILRNLVCHEEFATDYMSAGSSLDLGLMGAAGQQARTFIGGLRSFLPACAARTVSRSSNGALLNERLGSEPGLGAFQLSQVRGFIQLKTRLEVADNSGARRVECIKVMKGSNAAKIGDIIMASVKDAQPRGKVKKGEVVTCVVVRAATQKLRRDGSEIRFDQNAVVLINKQGEPIGTRVFGPVPHELRRRKLVKILTLAEYVA